MKKTIAILLIIATSLGLAACGTINDVDVAVLWDDEGTVKVPHSLINAFDRAMYIESIAYTHYGAEGDADKQVSQAKEALGKGCAALLVKLVDSAKAQTIVDLAKESDTPVIFFSSNVDAAVVESYDKCAIVNTDEKTLTTAMSDMIAAYIEESVKAKIKSKDETKKSIDRNNDGVISYVIFGSEATPDIIAELEAALAEIELTEGKIPTLKFYDDTNADKFVSVDDAKAQMSSILSAYNDEANNTVELIISSSDVATIDILVELQNKGFNREKLNTHLIPVYTIGYSADYKSYVLEGKPEGELDSEAVRAYFEENMYLVDLSVVEEEDLDGMIYNTFNVIDTGRILGTAIEDYDAIASAVAKLTASLIKDASALNGAGSDGKNILVPYITYNN